MTFTGWPHSAIPFFEGLEADNSRDYWLAHKSVYDGEVRAPIEALAADLAAEFGPAVLFRPYRDVRFSADKSPYKTQVAAVLGDTGDGAYYLQLSADGLMTGAGLHVMTPDQVARLRASIDAEKSGAALESIVARLLDVGFEQGGDQLKTAPWCREGPPAHRLAALPLLLRPAPAPSGRLAAHREGARRRTRGLARGTPPGRLAAPARRTLFPASALTASAEDHERPHVHRALVVAP